MSSKQQRAIKDKEHKASKNEGWTALSWDDLTEWAGSRSVERGRAYQRQGRVHDLAISEDGWLLASVTGGERYAVTVWCEQSAKKGGASIRAARAQWVPAAANTQWRSWPST